MDEFEQELTAIERITSDEVFEQICGLATVLAEQLKAGTCLRSDAEALVVELNAMLDEEHFHDQSVTVVGGIFIGDTYGDEEMGAFPTPDQFTEWGGGLVRLDKFELKTQVVLDADGVTEANVVVLSGWVVVGGESDASDDEDDDSAQVEACYIPLGPDVTLSYDQVTPRRAAHWLEACYPDLYEDLIAVLMQADDEAEALMALKDIMIDTTGLAAERRLDLAENLAVYVKEALRFDSYVPYLAELIGQAEIMNGGTEVYDEVIITSQEKTLLTLDQVQYKETDDGQIVLWLEGTLIGAKPGGASLIKLPLATIDSIVPGRQFYREQ